MSSWLVTGGAGFIGSHVVERLVAMGERVTVLDDFSTGFKDNLRPWLNDLSLVEGDIRDLAVVQQAMAGIDYVLHLAAQGSVPRSLAEPARALDVNTKGTLHILMAARETGVQRVVVSSSSSVYGRITADRQVETLTAKPASPYALSKLAAEHFTRLFHELDGVETVVLRYFNVFGPRQNPNSAYAAVIPLFITQAMQDRSVTIHGDGTQSRDFTFVENVVNANLAAAYSPAVKLGEAYNVACGATISINDLYEAIQQHLGIHQPPQYVAQRAGDIPRSLADIRKAVQDLDWQPLVQFDEGLARTIAWYRQNAVVNVPKTPAAASL